LNDKIYSKNNPLNYYRYLNELNNEKENILNKIKLNKFKNILLYFNDNLSFYKNLLLNNNINREDLVNLQSLEFISKLPILNKKILKENIIEINNLSN
jgi:phenylacetate-coenzyme A ligase PaaK-like adenylate-forming protein